jgi:mono/diheme cytochrome c family protein
MKWYIALGTASVLLTVVVTGFLGLTEPARMSDFAQAFHARQIENGAALFENNCRTCHGPQGRGIDGVAPALNTAALFNGSRLEQIGYAGSVESYVRGTIAAGRPVPSQGTNYPQRMPTWSQEFGGPMRDDEIESLVAFVMNWEEDALARAEPTPAAPAGEMVGTDINIELPQGDPENGRALAEGSLGCTACHILSNTGPPWEAQGDALAVGARAAQRMHQDNYTGEATTAEQYLVESILRTNAHVVEGYQPGVMPPDYGSRLTVQQLADLVAYLMTMR